MRIRVLGPAEVRGASGAVQPLERKARELLTILALRSPEAVTVDELTDLLWDAPPRSATKSIQSHLSRLRTAIDATTGGSVQIERAGTAAYRLVAANGELDRDVAVRNRQRARLLRSEGRNTEAAAAFAEVRSLWRGPVELPGSIASAALAARCEHDHRQLVEEHLAAVVAGDSPADAVAELRALTIAEPHAEPLWVLLVAALHRSGEPAEALRAARAARAALGDIGLVPGNALRAAEQAALQDPPGETSDGHGATGPVAASAVRYTTADEHRIAYIVLGTGETGILLLNPGVISIDGLGDEPRFTHAVTRLGALGRVVTFDRRGMGLSDRGGPPPSLEDWVTDAAAVLGTAVDGPAILVANSDACLLAIALAASQPHLVRALVLVHGYARYTRADDYPWGVDPNTASAVSAEVLSLDDRPTRFDPLSHIAPSAAADPHFRLWWDTLGRRAASPTSAAALHAVIHGSDVRPILAGVAQPALLIHRETCASADVGHLRYLSEHLVASRVAMLPGADELWFVGDADGLLDEVERFVRSLPPR